MDERRLALLVEQAVTKALKNGELVARLSETELNTIAYRVADVLEERVFPALAEPGPEKAPRGRRAKRRGYFKT